MSYDDKSSVYYYLQCKPPGQSGVPVGLVNEMCISSFTGHHVDKTMTPGAVISVDNLDINTVNPLSQCDHQVKESTAVEDVALLGAEVPDTHCSGSICGMSVMNWKKFVDWLEYRLVYIHEGSYCVSRGFYWATGHVNPSIWHLSHCSSVPEGTLQVLEFVYVRDDCVSLDAAPYEIDMYSDYLRDLQCRQKFGYSYTEYMQHVIDQLCHMQDDGLPREIVLEGVSPHECVEQFASYKTAISCHNDGVDEDASHALLDEGDPNTTNTFSDPVSTAPQQSNASLPCNSCISGEQLTLLRDINDPHKTTGYLAHDETTFCFVGPDRLPQSIDTVERFVAVAEIIQSTNLPNYKMARIPVSSSLNIPAWERYLSDYPDKRVIQYLKFGFPLSLTEGHNLHNTDVSNHASAVQYPEAVTEYSEKEMALGAILGPVDKVPHDNYHCSPLLTRPKDLNKRRVILDLSYPAGASVNHFVDKTLFDGSHFTLKFPTVDNIVQEIINCNDDPHLIKIDVSRAFRNLRVDPRDGLKFGLKWGDSYFIDGAIAFGWVHGSASFQLASDAVRFIMKKKGFDVFAYIDDFIIVSPKHKAHLAFHALHDLLSELGLPINPAKCDPPSKVLICLGIEVNIDANSISIPTSKIDSILEECTSIYGRTCISKHAFKSLLGKLLYVHRCVRPARMFVNRMLWLFRKNSGKRRICLNEEFKKDLFWFIKFLPAYNGITIFRKQPLQGNETLHIDACLTGMGGVWNENVYSTPIFGIPERFRNITNLEMINILVALRVWAEQWAHKKVLFRCDNLAVVQVIQTSRTRDQFLACCLRNIWLIVSVYDIELDILHISGKTNRVADALSRLYSDKAIPDDIKHDLDTRYQFHTVPPDYFNLDIGI